MWFINILLLNKILTCFEEKKNQKLWALMKNTYCVSGVCPNKQNTKHQIRGSGLIHPYQGGFTHS